jgi:hypothetical protein
VTDTALSIPSNETDQTGLARFQPANLKQLVWFAGEVAKSGMYLKTTANGDQVPMTQAETFMVMSEGIEMGVAPLTAMRNIYLTEDKKGRKTTIPRADLIAARIQADPRCERWDVDDETPGKVTIQAKRQSRPGVTLTLKLEDIPARDRDKWARAYLDTQEMLLNRTIRRIARRHFKDMVLGMGVDIDADDTKIIDVAKVDNAIDRSTDYPRPHSTQLGHQCYGKVFLESSAKGGAYLRCQACGLTFTPPQEVRDLIRGTPAALTLAGAAEPVLEPGERTEESEPIVLDHQTLPVPENVAITQTGPTVVEAAPESAVQSEYEGATLDGEDVVAPAAAEAVIPELDPRAANQAIRNAIYQHWIQPRPTQFKIDMRSLLDDFGWKGAESLGDWLLTLPDDKLAAVADGMAGIS